MSARAAAFATMREHFREQAQKNMALYQEFCGPMPEGGIEAAIDVLWLTSVTDESSAHYYASVLWRLITQEVLLRDHHACMACGRDAELVHHRSYRFEVMAGLDDSGLISLCKPCHHYVHFHKLKKLPKTKWEKRLRRLQKFFVKKNKKAARKKR